MDHRAEREQIVDFARRASTSGLSVGTSGNLSIRVPEGVLITPSGRDAETADPGDICLVDVDGFQVSGDYRPSSEVPMHLAVYRHTDAVAVVHTHSPFATAVSVVLDELPAVHYTINGLGGPVRVAPYATFGSAPLAANLAAALDQRTAAILQNHGTVAIGATLRQAYERAVLLEWLCALYWRARQIGEPRILTPAELDDVRQQSSRLRYGSQR
ncbi:MAG: class II aldolase/adducin family protein [Ilumatobacteraceae bacterium]